MTGVDMRRITAGVAAALNLQGGGWSATPGPNPAGGLVVHKDGRGFHMWVPYGDHARIQVRGCFPDGWRGLRLDSGPLITLAPRRAPADMAKDIARRFLPAYEPILEQARASMAREGDLAAAREVTVSAILAAIPGAHRSACQPREDGVDLELPRVGNSWRSNVRVHRDGRVTIECNGLPAETAIRLAEAFTGPAGPDTGRPAVRPARRPRRRSLAAPGWLRVAVLPALPGRPDSGQ